MTADDAIGVVQGYTTRPEGTELGDWTLWREVTAPSPWFEACNIFYRRAALERTNGFDEEIANYGEDTALGWAVLEAGWRRGFAEGAVVHHDVEERGVRYHLKTGLLERNVARLAKRYPDFRNDAFWRPWVFRRDDALFSLAIAGIALAPWRRSALLLTVPYLRRLHARLPAGRRRVRYLVELLLVDGAKFVGMRVGCIRYRIVVV